VWGRRAPRPELLFVHVPKTAGSTLLQALEHQYGSVARLYGPDHPGAIDPEDFVALSPAARRAFGAVVGHVPVELDLRLPRRDRRITLLRDPVDRVVSHFAYASTMPHLAADHGLDVPGHDLEWFVTSAPSERLVQNAHVRLLGGDGHSPPPVATDESLARARENLESRFDAFGFSERFDEALALFGEVLGWAPVSVQPVNVNPDRPATSEIPARTRALIEEHNRLDLELYEHARSLYERRFPAADRNRRRAESPAERI
jgi:hypothetical protein